MKLIQNPWSATRYGSLVPTLLGSEGGLRPQAGRRRVDAFFPDAQGVTTSVRAMGGVDADPGLRTSRPPTT